jgi:hypothetical protein
MDLAKYKKGIAAIVAALVSVGGITALFPTIPAALAATITGVVGFLAVLLGPANEDSTTPPAPVRPAPEDPTYLSN